MACLFVSASWPGPLAGFRHGTAQRMRLLLRGLMATGEAIDALFFHHPETTPSETEVNALRRDMAERWQVTLRHIVVVPQARELRMNDGLWRSYLRPMLGAKHQPHFSALAMPEHAKAMRACLEHTKPNLIVVHRLRTMQALLACGVPTAPVVLDLDDIEHKAFRRSLALPPHWRTKHLMRAWVPAIRRLEKAAMKCAMSTLVCSDADAQELRLLYPGVKALAVPNALPVPARISELPPHATIMFIGIYSYAPNLAAAKWLVHEIWPLVKKARPEAQLLLAGRDAQLLAVGSESCSAGVQVLGFVDDLGELYDRTRVVVCPVQSGGGTRVKIIEAALYGRPVVSTSVGCEGLAFKAERQEIVVADDAPRFAQAIVALIEDQGAAQRQAMASRSAALAHYGEDGALRLLRDEFVRHRSRAA